MTTAPARGSRTRPASASSESGSELTRTQGAAWVDENEPAYRKLIESAGSVPEVGALIGDVRDRTSARILVGIGATTPQARAAVRAWLWFMDGAILDWFEHRDLDRSELCELLLGSLAGALSAAGTAGWAGPPSPSGPPPSSR